MKPAAIATQAMKAQASDEIDARLAIQDVWGVSGADATDMRAVAEGVRLIGVVDARGAAGEESIFAGCGAGKRGCSAAGRSGSSSDGMNRAASGSASTPANAATHNA